MNSPGLQIRQSSAQMWGGGTGQRKMAVVSKYIDTSTCIGCKACEVACQEWNDLGNVATVQIGSYQTVPTLHADLWNLIKFNEQTLPDGGFAWLMRKDQCMHCADPGACIGCKMCETGCPFDVPRYAARTDKMAKCTLCVDRVDVGLEPACVKACPTGCLHFGTKDDMLALADSRVEQLKGNGFAQAAVYDPPGVGGTGVVTVLSHGDHPEWYGLPKDPHVPTGVRFWKNVLRPVGVIAFAAAFFAMVGHYLTFGPKKPKEGGEKSRGEGPV